MENRFNSNLSLSDHPLASFFGLKAQIQLAKLGIHRGFESLCQNDMMNAVNKGNTNLLLRA